MRRSVVSAGQGEEDDGSGRTARWRVNAISAGTRPHRLRRRPGGRRQPGVPARHEPRGAGHAGLELVGEADGGAAALDAIARVRPDVVLLDLRMPDIDGLGVLERLRDLDPPPQSRVLLVSASLDEDTERAALAAGAVGCVSKELARADICAAALRVARQ